MRTTFLLIAVLTTTSFFAQNPQNDFRISSQDTVVEALYYKHDINPNDRDYAELTGESPINRYRHEYDSIVKIWESREKEEYTKPLFLEGTLNLLFAEKLGAAFGSSNSLSLQKGYFNLDASEKSFSFGYNVDNRGGDALKPLNWVLGIGAKVVASDGFALISTSGDFEEDNIGANLKFSWVGNGTIAWSHSNPNRKGYKNYREEIEKRREFLFYRYNEKVKDYNKNTIPAVGKMYEALKGSEVDRITAIDKELCKQSNKFYEEMIREELNYIDSEGLYTAMWNWWTTLEVYLPFGDKHYDITPITADNKASKAQYYAFNTNVSLNGYYQKPSGVSLFGKLVGGVKGNSNIAVDGKSSKEFQSIIIENGAPVLTDPVSAIPIDEYKRFVTPSLKAEVVIFYKNKVGFSPSVEKNWGDYDGVNWKLGIPISLKPKKGESRVNFELQWLEKETMMASKHYIGFTSSFLLGSLVK